MNIVSLSPPQLVGSMCAISGVLVMSLPIPIIAGNFEKFHKTLVRSIRKYIHISVQAKKNKLLKRRSNLKEAKIKEEKVTSSVITKPLLPQSRLAELVGETEVTSPIHKARSPVLSLLTNR